ncbi:hypothetical protein BDA99DRAFT_440440 [Phascolomyces articulosus]|uniref:Uncharacterized protein n=1 Tax=Phascolomyces articulosus TaxID=60185 RepID=A0AAD5K719_9FUNG|nr:hypothetical protein BDA99DRAFT_440440 [Phascolomyces articulosus]
MQQPPFTLLPATCELCGNWLPDHSETCPRNGVHPSQWTMKILITEHDNDHHHHPHHHDIFHTMEQENESDQED